MEPVNLDAYLGRVGLSAAPERSVAGLTDLLHAHMQAIPFENLDILLGATPSLKLPDIEHKLVTRRRGGYCFEHATLFKAVLESLGFPVTAMAARVILNIPVPVTPRTHMLLRVEAEGTEYLADPGFGGPGPRVPLVLGPGETTTENGTYRFSEQGGELLLQRLDDELSLYRFLRDEVPAVDFLVANHFTATFPRSQFVQRIVMMRATVDGTVSLANQQLTVRSGADVESRELESREELRAVLDEHFGIHLPEAEAIRVPSYPPWAE